MKIEKLNLRSYRIRKMYRGVVYTVVTDHKPTQKEALQLIAAEMDKIKQKHDKMTFDVAATKYLDVKGNVLSPSTIKGYNSILENLPKYFRDMCISDIDSIVVQKVINVHSANHSPKCTRNVHGFISAVLGMFCQNMILRTSLPQKLKNEPHIPSDDDVKKILAELDGSIFKIPIILACYGMRRSEICALDPSDIHGDIVTINKAKVQDKDHNWIIKTTKTTSSTRTIIIPMEIADEIRKQGYVYNGHPNSITNHLRQVEDKLGIEHFTLHKLRHYFASRLSSMNVPEADIMKLGGWKSDHVMKEVYRHSMIDNDIASKREASDQLKNVLFS